MLKHIVITVNTEFENNRLMNFMKLQKIITFIDYKIKIKFILSLFKD